MAAASPHPRAIDGKGLADERRADLAGPLVTGRLDPAPVETFAIPELARLPYGHTPDGTR